MDLTIPKNVVDNEYIAFPKGSYAGEYNRVEDNSRGEQGSDDWRFSLRTFFRNLKPADGETTDPGARPFRADIQLVWDGVSILELQSVEQISDLPFQLQRGVAHLTQLAVALGAAGRNEAGGVSFNLGEFVEKLRDGFGEDTPVKLTVEHYLNKLQVVEHLKLNKTRWLRGADPKSSRTRDCAAHVLNALRAVK